MKNIHVLPTDKPSRLVKNDKNLLKLCIQTLPLDKEIGCIPQNIYITSDEEIKVGDWFIWKDTEEPYIFKCIGLTDTDSLQVENSLTRKIGTFHRNPKDSDYGDWYRCYSKKIVLTTYQELIKDGVQAIDDEFLKWFVENPSCDKVDVQKTNTLMDLYADKEEDIWRVRHHIYIPKEESKQEISYSEEEVFKLLCSMPNFFNMTIPQQIRARKEWFEKSKK